jgi:FSR family fosmidomycin resistance protein-like MFS transporter
MNSTDWSVVKFTMVGHALFHAYELSIPVFIIIWLDVFTTTEALIGLIVGVGYAAIGIGAVPSGILSDKYGSSRVILVALLGMGFGFGLISISPNIVILALALAIWGISASLYHPAGLSLLSRSIEDRGTAFAYHGVAGNVGTILGPLLISILLIFLPWRSVAALSVVPALVGVSIAFKLPLKEGKAVESTKSKTPVWKELYEDTQVLLVSGFPIIISAVLLYGLYYRGTLTFLPEILLGIPILNQITLFGYTLNPSQYIYTALLTAGVGGQYAGGRLTDVVEAEYALIMAFVSLVVCALAFIPALASGFISLLIMCLLIGFVIYVTAPIYQAVIAEYAANSTHGLSYGYTYLGMFGIGALGAPLAGTAVSYTSPRVLFLTLAGIAGLAGIMSIYLLAWKKN